MSNCDSQEWTCDVTCPDKNEIERAIRKLKSNKATGDEIPAEFYNYAPKAKDVLIAMIQEIWLTEIPIKEWLECKITLIHEVEDQKLPSNYRPIALLTIGEKLLSTIIMNRIKEDFNRTLHEWQTGFRHTFSSRHPVYYVTKKVRDAITSKKKLGLIMIDFKKACDSLKHDAIANILPKLGMPTKLTRLIVLMQAHAKLKIKFDQRTSASMRQEHGIRQGSALSPSIFVFFCRLALKEAQDYYLQEDKRLSWRAYAENVCLMGDNHNEIEIGLKAIQATTA